MRQRLIFRNAFTLVELLVVMVIIAVLAALTLPMLASAKDRAKSGKCANNERQLSMGFNSYLNDNSGAYPYQNPSCFCTNYIFSSCNMGTAYCVGAVNTHEDGGGWNHVIGPYLGCSLAVLNARIGCNICGIVGCCPGSVTQTYNTYAQLLQCPSNPWPYFTSNNNVSNYRLSASNYQMNTDLFPVNWAGGSPTNSSGWSRRARMSDISYGANAMLLGEIPLDFNVKDNPWGAANTTGWGYVLPYAATVGIQDQLVSNYWGTAWGGVLPDPRTWLVPNNNAFVSAWHGLSMNVLFVDGHVERVSKATLCSYSKDMTQTTVNLTPNTSPGGIFWTDGKGARTSGSGLNMTYWYASQFPGASYPD